MKSLAPKLAVFCVLFLLPFFLRAAPIEHGLPRNYVPDTHIVRNALGMAQDKNLVPRVNEYSQYPNLLPYLLLPCYATEFVVGKIAGRWSDARGFGDHVLEHPEDPELVARWLVLAFGALTPWVVFRATRAAGLQRGAWISAWLVATGLLHLQFSVHERPWVPVVFFMVLAAWPSALYSQSGRTKHLVLGGVAAGLSLACHQGGLAAPLIPGLAWLFGPLAWRDGGLRERAKQIALFVLVFAVVAVVFGHPYLLRYGWPKPEDVVGGEMAAKQGGITLGGLAFVFGARLDSVVRLSRACFGYDPAVVLLGLAGLTLALRHRVMRPLMIFVIVWTAIFLTQQSDHARYLLPLTVFLAWPAGLLCERFLDRRASAIAVACVLAIPLVQALRFDWVLSRPDTRFAAEAELAELPPGSIVAIDRYGPDVDLSESSLVRLAELRARAAKITDPTKQAPPVLRARERHRLEQLRAGDVVRVGRGLDAVDLEELFDVDRAGGVSLKKELADFAPSMRDALKKLGVTHVLLVNRRPVLQVPQFAASLLDSDARPLWIVDPSTNAEHPTKECFLPTEMDYPLEGLWTVNRPGPWMALYELR